MGRYRVRSLRSILWLLMLVVVQLSDAAIFDIDNDGTTAALTDGLLVLRHQFGFAGQALDQVPDSVGPTN